MQYDDNGVAPHDGGGFYWGYASRVNFWIALSVLGLSMYMVAIMTGRIQMDLVSIIAYIFGLEYESWQLQLFMVVVLGLVSIAVLRPILPLPLFWVMYVFGLGIVGALYAEFLADEYRRVPAWNWFVLQPGLVAGTSFFLVSLLGLVNRQVGEWGRGDGLWTLLLASLIAGSMMFKHYGGDAFLPVFPDSGGEPTYIRHFLILTSWTIFALLGEAYYKYRPAYQDYREGRPPIREAAGVVIATLWLLLLLMLLLVREGLRTIIRSL